VYILILDSNQLQKNLFFIQLQKIGVYMLINKNNLPLVAMDFMNETHFEDVEIINELYKYILEYEKEQNELSLKNLEIKYKEWITHTENHFETEEIQMREKGFFAYEFHKNEHNINLSEIKQLFNNFQETKNILELKSYFENNLVSWLVNHIQTMDTVTAMFFKTGMSPCSMH
jgi:hemerythrin